MFVCPRCTKPLIRTKSEKGFFFGCPSCRGRAIGLPVLRRLTANEPVRELWRRAREMRRPSGPRCPVCRKRMAPVPVPVENARVDLDVCTSCQFVWFDTNELEQLPQLKPSGPPPEEPRSRKTREFAAIAKTKRVAAEAELKPGLLGGPADAWKWIPGILGMPVECHTRPITILPWLTWGLAAALVAVFLATVGDLRQAIEQFGLVPSAYERLGGMTLLTSFFLHAGFWHLLGNTYFLLIFGDNVEDYLGRLRYVSLIFLATIAGDFAHIALEPRSEMPCIGASGGISGIIAFYALSFPRARLGIMLRFWVVFKWFYMPAWGAMVLWILLQVFLAAMQIAGTTNVSAVAHLGGAAVGLGAWLLWREQ